MSKNVYQYFVSLENIGQTMLRLVTLGMIGKHSATSEVLATKDIIFGVVIVNKSYAIESNITGDCG